MATQPDNKVDSDQPTPEEDAFTSEGGHVGQEPEARAEPTDTTVDERPGVDVSSGFRDGRLADAESYARLCQRKQALEGAP